MDSTTRELALRVLEDEILPELKRVFILYLDKCSTGEDLIRYLNNLKELTVSLESGTFGASKWSVAKAIAEKSEVLDVTYREYSSLKEAILDLRDQVSWTQTTLSHRAKVSNKSISGTEQGKEDMSVKARSKIADAFGLSDQDKEHFIILPFDA